ncbi:FAD binding domain-containing protein [Levilinea saccharolytica]|uniref:FAD binding domain-containing protein n=1 Tax=Levilinea saccharolytica TaxID=229921 RepID=UPI0009462105|nr:xanthine dehydrogenase family protein subunit M [Levilinea saccharolytica]GAP18083.1 aerobic-type carbon monoxide dehydrogenase, middle subunit CoxM/CutM homologs [Levilinea saccharolytica]
MTIWNHYYLPSTLDEAIELLNQTPGSARVIAGGTDLLLDLQQGRHAPVDTLVDVNQVREMLVLEMRGTHLFIGASVPLNQITTSELVLEHAQALSEASGLIGGPQVRNTGTLGGNVAHALPAADGTISIMALNAEVEIASAQGLRRQALNTLFLGPGKSALDPHGEIISGFYLPVRKANQASGFSRIMRPQGVALPVINMAAWLERDGDRIQDIRIAVGPSGPIPQRITAAEDALRGRPYNEESLSDGLKAMLNSVKFRTSPQRATAEYRQKLAGVLLREVIQKVWQRAGGPVSHVV